MLFKKSVIATTVGIAALGMSAAALANGYGSNGFTSSSDAGFVIGAQAGYGDTHWNDFFSVFPGVSTDHTGFAARGFVGYDINKCFGIEAGYTYLPTTTLSANGQSADIDSYGLDLLGKISLPITPVFKIYAKAGLGYLHASADNNLGGGSQSHTGPAYGVGAAYEVIPNLSVDAGWLRYSGQGNLSDSNYIPQADVALVGLSYKFPIHRS